MATLDIYNEFLNTAYPLSGPTSVIRAKREGHVSQPIEPGKIEERYPIVGKPTPTLSLEDETNKIVEHGVHAQLYHQLIERSEGVWLREGTDNDTYQRRAIIYSISIRWFAQRGKNRLFEKGTVFYGELIIVRHEDWEIPIKRARTINNLNLNGGQVTITGDYNRGNVGARIDELTISNPRIPGTPDNPVDYYTLWMGIREKGLGFSNVGALVENSAGTYGADTSGSSQTYFHGGTAADVSFATQPGMVDRVTWTLGNLAASTPEHYFGEYLILLGYQHGAGANDIIQAQLTGDAVISGPPITLPSTSTQRSRLKELGYIRLPGQTFRNKYPSLDISDVGFSVAASRSGGSAHLFIDFIIFMPSRHAIKIIPGNQVDVDSSRLYFHEHPEGTLACYQAKSGLTKWRYNNSFEPQNFELPPDDAMLVVAADTDWPYTNPNDMIGDFDMDFYLKYSHYVTHTGI